MRDRIVTTKGGEHVDFGRTHKKVRKALDLTQQAFAEQIGSTQNALTGYETGRRNPSAAALNNICKTFNISETWLRTGEGEMFLQVSKEDELSAAVHKLLSGETSEFKTRLIKILADLGPREWDILEQYALKLVQDRPIQTMTEEEEIDQKVKLYRQQLHSEKEREKQALSVKESGVG